MHFPDLQGKIALITGATRLNGIGAATCRALAAQGCDIFFTTFSRYDQAHYGTSPDEAAELSDELTQQGMRVGHMDVDLSDPNAATRVLDTAEDMLGFPQIVVNNAAYSGNDDFRTLDAASLDTHYAVNVRAMALLSVQFARRFTLGSGGRIINMTSGQGLGAMPGEISYATTKGAVEAFTRTLAAEVAHLGIAVNAIDPGATDTGWMKEDIRTELTARMGMGRLGQPEDAARLITFLASDAGQWITGQVLYSRGA